jgi:hypothetical protein
MHSQEVFPEAMVSTEQTDESRVKIIAAKQNLEIANVPQRDLFRKYGWPAKPGMIQRLQIFKEELTSEQEQA